MQLYLKNTQYQLDSGAVAMLVVHPLLFPGGTYLVTSEEALSARMTGQGNWGDTEALAEANALAAVDPRFAGMAVEIVYPPTPERAGVAALPLLGAPTV